MHAHVHTDTLPNTLTHTCTHTDTHFAGEQERAAGEKMLPDSLAIGHSHKEQLALSSPRPVSPSPPTHALLPAQPNRQPSGWGTCAMEKPSYTLHLGETKWHSHHPVQKVQVLPSRETNAFMDLINGGSTGPSTFLAFLCPVDTSFKNHLRLGCAEQGGGGGSRQQPTRAGFAIW